MQTAQQEKGGPAARLADGGDGAREKCAVYTKTPRGEDALSC